MLALPGLLGVSEATVRDVVLNNEKQRFAMVTDDGGCAWIRANQGAPTRVVFRLKRPSLEREKKKKEHSVPRDERSFVSLGTANVEMRL